MEIAHRLQKLWLEFTNKGSVLLLASALSLSLITPTQSAAWGGKSRWHNHNQSSGRGSKSSCFLRWCCCFLRCFQALDHRFWRPGEAVKAPPLLLLLLLEGSAAVEARQKFLGLLQNESVSCDRQENIYGNLSMDSKALMRSRMREAVRNREKKIQSPLVRYVCVYFPISSNITTVVLMYLFAFVRLQVSNVNWEWQLLWDGSGITYVGFSLLSARYQTMDSPSIWLFVSRALGREYVLLWGHISAQLWFRAEWDVLGYGFLIHLLYRCAIRPELRI